MPATLSDEYHKDIEENGFTVIRSLLTKEQIEGYLAYSNAMVALARNGNWNYIRLNGKQFPPWDKPSDRPDIWGVTHLMHPKTGPLGIEFQKLYCSDVLTNVVKDILQTDQLNMELFNLLTNPTLKDFDLCWHRDDIKNTATPGEEMEVLSKDAYAGAQFNLALTNDENLIVVPKSHRRVRSEEERNKLKYEEISGQLIVKLNPGDCVFYNPNILHRATYSTKRERVTLHGCYGSHFSGKSRARLILQHGVGDWIEEMQPINSTMGVMADRLKEIAKEMKGRQLGYSLDG